MSALLDLLAPTAAPAGGMPDSGEPWLWAGLIFLALIVVLVVLVVLTVFAIVLAVVRYRRRRRRTPGATES